MVISFILVALFLSSCANSDDKAQTDTQNPVASSLTVSEKEPEESDPTPESDWGVPESIVAENGENISTAYIRFPSLAGIIRGTGKIAYQTDKTLVILDSQRMSGSPEVSDKSVLPSYFEQTNKIMERYRRSNYSDFDFSISEQQTVKVNDYDMVKYIGIHTCKCDGKPLELKFVAYSTKLKANDACIYWMVLDESEDQSLSQTILEYAEKMADSLHE